MCGRDAQTRRAKKKAVSSKSNPTPRGVLADAPVGSLFAGPDELFAGDRLSTRMVLLDGLRGIAASSVVLWHRSNFYKLVALFSPVASSCSLGPLQG